MKLIVENLLDNEVEVKENEVGFLVITGVFLKKTSQGNLNELNFLPFHKELADIQIKLSNLREVGAMWQRIDNLNNFKD